MEDGVGVGWGKINTTVEHSRKEESLTLNRVRGSPRQNARGILSR